MTLCITIPYYEINEGSVYYLFQVTSHEALKTWEFRKRYSEIRELYVRLKDIIAEEAAFPAKTMFSIRDPDFVEQRRAELQDFFVEVVGIESVRDNPDFKEFIMPKERAYSANAEEDNPPPFTNRNSQTSDRMSIDQELAALLGTVANEYSAKYINVKVENMPANSVQTSSMIEKHDYSVDSITRDVSPFPKHRQANGNYLCYPLMSPNWIDSTFTRTLSCFSEELGLDYVILASFHD